MLWWCGTDSSAREYFGGWTDKESRFWETRLYIKLRTSSCQMSIRLGWTGEKAEWRSSRWGIHTMNDFGLYQVWFISFILCIKPLKLLSKCRRMLNWKLTGRKGFSLVWRLLLFGKKWFCRWVQKIFML